jgi:hypothetical protein
LPLPSRTISINASIANSSVIPSIYEGGGLRQCMQFQRNLLGLGSYDQMPGYGNGPRSPIAMWNGRLQE